MPRVFILVLDSVGIGSAPDAARYGDEGADTVGHIAEFCQRAMVDGIRAGRLTLPHLAGLGFGEACRVAAGRVPDGLGSTHPPRGRYGCAREVSNGKDTPSGHWELAGVPVPFDWGYFPRQVPCFPPDLIRRLCQDAGIAGILGDRHASGTEIIRELGVEHMRSGKPICYTSADSVFQIAAHEQRFGLERLYEVCRVARRLLDPLAIGRVIARPFLGTDPGNSSPTLLDLASNAGRDVVSLGKIADIFAHSGTGRAVKGDGNAALLDRLIAVRDALEEGGLAFANFIDFDSLYGHRRDPAGYAAALEAFDARLPELESGLRPGDLVIITADHGCDPTWPGTDHTRELVPVLAFGPGIASGPIGCRATFADVAATAASHLRIQLPAAGSPF